MKVYLVILYGWEDDEVLHVYLNKDKAQKKADTYNSKDCLVKEMDTED
jgi:hypothetical protein